ncbi:MAG: hypothetical protein NVS1B13_19750 [Flavisolibacter sp.]
MVSLHLCSRYPIRFIDPDGVDVVDHNSKHVRITYNKKGTLSFSKNATADIKRIANALNLTDVYEGTFKEGIKEGSGLKHEGLTMDQTIGAVAVHEIVHATDKSEINKDIKYEQSKMEAGKDHHLKKKPSQSK